MKVDYPYLKALLEAFEIIDSPFPYISDLASASKEVDRNFAFHMGILYDQGFVQFLTKSRDSPFYPDHQEEDGFSWADCNVRLTAQGYDFLAALHQKDIWNAIKNELKESSVETVWKVAQGVATKFASSALQKYVGDEAFK